MSDERLREVDEHVAYQGPLRAACPSCGAEAYVSCTVMVPAAQGDVRPGDTRRQQVLGFHEARFVAAGCEEPKQFNSLGVDYYVDEVLSIERDFPGSAQQRYGVAGPAAVKQAARDEFERAEHVEDLEYSHVLQID